MQLFSIGLYRLNPDGSRMLGAGGQPIPTYDEAAVKGLAAAFTGWNFAGNDTSKPSVFDPAKENWVEPLLPWEMWHDNGAKTLFDGITLPANQGARKDMKDALDAIFRHPNVGPFIGRQLIQRFVTSNPSPAYIARVAAAFDNNGQGVRGDLRAVLRAVLLDPEARDPAKTAETGWGKQREPVIRFANFLRGLNARSTSGRNRIWYLDSADEGLNQSPLLAPSVFNFFSPNYRHPGALAAAGLVAPEFQVTTETSMVGGLNFFARLIRNGYYGKDDTRLTFDLAAAERAGRRSGGPGRPAEPALHERRDVGGDPEHHRDHPRQAGRAEDGLGLDHQRPGQGGPDDGRPLARVRDPEMTGRREMTNRREFLKKLAVACAATGGLGAWSDLQRIAAAASLALRACRRPRARTIAPWSASSCSAATTATTW